MSRRVFNGPPTPEEFQRQLAEFMRQQFQGARRRRRTEPAEAGAPESPGRTEGRGFRVRLQAARGEGLPGPLRHQAGRGQEGAERGDLRPLPPRPPGAARARTRPNYAKQNIILLGPTGVGKTYLIRCVGRPDRRAVRQGRRHQVLRDRLRGRRRGGPGARPGAPGRRRRRRARSTASSTSTRSTRSPPPATLAGRDVSGRGVQTNLLKLMEETEVPARSPNDIAGQIQAMMEFTQRRAQSAEHDQHPAHPVHRQRRVRRAGEDHPQAAARGRRSALRAKDRPPETHGGRAWSTAQTRDFIEFGFEPEFIGRLPVRVVCHPLNGGRPVPHPEELRGQHHPPVRAGLRGLRHRGAVPGRRPAADRRAGRARSRPARAA